MDPYRAQMMGDGENWDDALYPDNAASAAISVAMMVATAAVVLAVMKKSGFRAMVAVGS